MALGENLGLLKLAFSPFQPSLYHALLPKQNVLSLGTCSAFASAGEG
jgi:hypothetical protein